MTCVIYSVDYLREDVWSTVEVEAEDTFDVVGSLIRLCLRGDTDIITETITEKQELHRDNWVGGARFPCAT